MITRARQAVKAATVRLTGTGIHTGAPCGVRILPPDEIGQGIVFRGASTYAAVGAAPGNVGDTLRCTALRSGDFSVQTVEHLMSACAGMGLTDATILVDGPELPILDGSALSYADAILGASLTECGGELETMTCAAPVSLMEGNSTIVAYPASLLSLSVIIDYPSHPAIGVQAAIYLGVNYYREIAPARTYGFLSEIETLQRSGLALGAGIENGIALTDDGTPDARTPLRFANELARHKLLDVIGDLALIGKELKMGIVAIRPNHGLNTRFAGLLMAAQENNA